MIPDQTAMKATVQAYVDCANAGDADGLIALFSPDASMGDWIDTPIRSRDEIAQPLVDGIADYGRITPFAPFRGSHANERRSSSQSNSLRLAAQGPASGRSMLAPSTRARTTSRAPFGGPEDVKRVA